VINDDFLDMHFPKEERKGWLYKGDIGSTFEYWGEDGARYALVFEKKTYESENDWSDLIALTRVLQRTPDEELEAKIGELLDIDSLLKALALDNLSVNLDSYVTMTQNFYIYRRPTDNKFEWLVWDPSLAFGSFPGGLNSTTMKTFPLEYTSAGIGGGAGGFPPGGGGQAVAVPRPLATRLWAVPSIKARYRELYTKLAHEVYLPENILARMNSMRDFIRPWVERDPNKLTTLTAFDNAMTVDAVGGPGGGPGGQQPGGNMGGGPAIEPLVRDRHAFVLRQLGIVK
jgi:spore coat protein CotH